MRKRICGLLVTHSAHPRRTFVTGSDPNHEALMRLALGEAEAAGEAGQLPIGAVLALGAEIVSRGRNRYLERRTRRHIRMYEGGTSSRSRSS